MRRMPLEMPIFVCAIDFLFYNVPGVYILHFAQGKSEEMKKKHKVPNNLVKVLGKQ